MKYLISACLIGDNCKYDGKNNLHDYARRLYEKGLVIPVCPEELGGLSTPRVPSEIVGNKVLNKEGTDVTREFLTGAAKTLNIALENDIKIAILQARSPSCGSSQIYDGTFSGTLIPGMGRTTQLLRENGIKVMTIEEFIEGGYETEI